MIPITERAEKRVVGNYSTHPSVTGLSPAPAGQHSAPGRLTGRGRQPEGQGLSPAEQQESAQHFKQGEGFCSDLILTRCTTELTQIFPLFQPASAGVISARV